MAQAENGHRMQQPNGDRSNSFGKKTGTEPAPVFFNRIDNPHLKDPSIHNGASRSSDDMPRVEMSVLGYQLLRAADNEPYCDSNGKPITVRTRQDFCRQYEDGVIKRFMLHDPAVQSLYRSLPEK